MWLQRFGAQRVKSFNHRRQSDQEAAASEPLITDYLRSRVDEIEPAEDLSLGGPDLRCVKKKKVFYVEVTSLKITAVEKTI